MGWVDGRAWLGALVATAMVAGCSGGGGNGPVEETDGTSSSSSATLTELVDEANTLADQALYMEDTSAADLPTSGTASYDGVMMVSTSDGNALIGDLDLSVDFGASNDPISGSVTGLVERDEGRWGGSLNVDNSVLDRETSGSPTWTANLEGTVTNPTDTAYEVDGQVEGGFGRSDASFIGGELTGEACAGDCVSMEGFLLADR